MRIIHKGLVLVGVPLAIAIAVIASMYGLILKTEGDRLEQQRRRLVAEDTCRIQTGLYNAGMALKEYLVDRDPTGRQRFRTQIAELAATRERLLAHDKATEYDPSLLTLQEMLQDGLDGMRDILANRHIDLNVIIRLSQMRGEFSERTFRLANQGHQIVANVLTDLQKSPEREARAFHFETAILLGGVIASILSGIMLARWFMSDVAARLQVITDNTLRMGRGDALNPQLAGNDEISLLDAGFHRTAEALRQAMAKERALFENASDIICVLDSEFKFAAVNPACWRILGYAPEDIMGRECFDVVASADREAVRALFQSTKVSKPSRSLEIRTLRKDGHVSELLWSVYWSHLDNALYAVAHDITERKHLERLKQEFLAMVSHDLRSPLTSILGTFQLIAAGVFGDLSTTLKEKIDNCTTNTNRLVGLVNDLLDIEKMESGSFDLHRTSVPVDELLNQATSEVQLLAQRRGIEIKVNSPGGEHFMDSDRMLQVLVNLLSNAIKFSPDNKVIELQATRQDDALNIKVIDEGRGVPASQRKIIFERFKQVKAEDGKRQAGTGLGLPICKQIVEQHGGTIGVDERAGGGSIFWLTLPNTTTSGTEAGIIPTLSKLSSAAAPDEISGGESSTNMPALQIPGHQKKAKQRMAPLSSMRLIHKGALLVFVPVVFELAFAGSLYAILTKAYQEEQTAIHYHLVSGTANDFLLAHSALIASMSAAKAHTPEGYQAFDNLCKDALQRENELKQLTSEDPDQARVMRNFAEVMVPVHDFLDRVHRRVERDGMTPEAIDRAFAFREQLEPTGIAGCDLVRRLLDVAQAKGAESPARLEAMNHQISLFLLAGLAVSVSIGIFSAFLFSSSINQRLQLLAANFKRLESGEALPPALEGADEVSRLDQFIHTMSDALREARRKERAVFNNSQDILIELLSDGTITRVNPASFNTWGLKPDEIIGKSIERILPEEAKKQFLSALADTSTSRHLELDVPMLRFNQTLCHMRWSLSCSNDKQAIIGVAHDVSHQKELERLKQEFLAMVSHDLRTPLSAIQGTSEMVVMGVFGDLPEQAKAQLTIVDRNCQRLLNLINDLLDIEKLESGSFKLNIAATAARDVIEKAVEAIATIAAEKSISVDIGKCDVQLDADGDRLVQVVINLLSNAIKFSPSDSTVSVSARETDEGIEFAIHDQGRGVPESHISDIFDRYRQVDSADGKRGKGTGLGLPICKQIVEQHGGRITVTSESGRGSTFAFVIPKLKQSMAQA